MINTKDGSILIKNTHINSKFTKDKFLDSQLQNELKRLDTYPGGYFNYHLKPQKIEEADFLVTLFYHNNQLVMIALILVEENEVLRWETWSLEKEMHRKQKHDEWLFKIIGPAPYKYPWGLIESGYSKKSGVSNIVIRYF
jgi:hypothetical protein